MRIDRVKDLMERRDINQSKLARLLGAPQTTVSGWLTQEKEPKHAMLCSLADLLCTTTDYLLGRTDEPMPLSVVTAAPNYVELTPFERTVLQHYREASEETKINICAILRLTHPAELRGKAKKAW